MSTDDLTIFICLRNVLDTTKFIWQHIIFHSPNRVGTTTIARTYSEC